jgi:YfiH family protein
MNGLLDAQGMPEGVLALTTVGGQHPHAVNYGLSCGASVQDALEARSRLEQHLDRRLRWLDQVHGCVVSGFGDPVARPKADASVSDDSTEALVILTADCLPVLFASDCGAVVGAAHAGWRGLAGGVLEATMQTLTAHLPRARWHAWIGPAIGASAYEVGAEVRSAFVEREPGNDRFFVPRAEKWLADLPGIAHAILHRQGVSVVTLSGECTWSNRDRWFSFRRDQDRPGLGGRMASVVGVGNRR